MQGFIRKLLSMHRLRRPHPTNVPTCQGACLPAFGWDSGSVRQDENRLRPLSRRWKADPGSAGLSLPGHLPVFLLFRGQPDRSRVIITLAEEQPQVRVIAIVEDARGRREACRLRVGTLAG